MKNTIFITVLSILMSLTLSAQITRQQADAIVWEYVQNEVTPPYVLYGNLNTPTEEGMIITTFNEEIVKVKYVCWAYYLNENPGTSEPSQHRYLFVKEDNGNLLEIITTNDFSPDLTEWEAMLGLANMKKELISIYPNPTTGELRIKNYELRIKSVDVFDVYGKKLLTNHLIPSSSNHLIPPSSNHLINIAHLPAGVYFVKISTEAGIQTQKVIKH